MTLVMIFSDRPHCHSSYILVFLTNRNCELKRELEKGSAISSTGALMVYSGTKTGRSPKDKRIVRHPESEKDIDWGSVNYEMDEHTFMVNRERAID